MLEYPDELLCIPDGTSRPFRSAVGAIAGMVNAGQTDDQATSQAQKAGAALGATLGMGMIFVLWFVVLTAALILGLFLKKLGIVEDSPTGPLAQALTRQAAVH